MLPNLDNQKIRGTISRIVELHDGPTYEPIVLSAVVQFYLYIPNRFNKNDVCERAPLELITKQKF